MSWRNFALTVGAVYRNRNGSDYLCEAIREPGCYIMKRVKDGWTLEAHTITMCEDGTIEWDYSTGGHWAGRLPIKACDEAAVVSKEGEAL